MTARIFGPKRKHAGGNGSRPPNPRREYYIKMFPMSSSAAIHLLTLDFIARLDRCKDDDARRVLLGISE